MAKPKNTHTSAPSVGGAEAGASEDDTGAPLTAAGAEVSEPATQGAAADDDAAASASPSSAAADGGDGQVDPDTSPTPVDTLAGTGETVEVLVLSDNHLGKVGQVIEVDAAHVEALRLGGLIDPHPNAIKAAGPQE
ncbi:hypothetical protein [Stenotrophomonas nematodicola]|uniref:hypothetical protein n=1 Tax=Stenotrophomonas nematodicola TaxID=2656746 RepID=UPI003D9A6AB9